MIIFSILFIINLDVRANNIKIPDIPLFFITWVLNTKLIIQFISYTSMSVIELWRKYDEPANIKANKQATQRVNWTLGGPRVQGLLLFTTHIVPAYFRTQNEAQTHPLFDSFIHSPKHTTIYVLNSMSLAQLMVCCL